MVASGVRIGTPAATMRGFDEDDFREVASIIVDALADDADVDGARRPRERALRPPAALPGLPRLHDLRHAEDGRPRGHAPARPAQAGAAAGRQHRHRDVPPARQRADAAPHLRGDEGHGARGRSRSRRRSSGRRAYRIPGKKVAVCPILRAGMGMLDGVLSLIPVARVGFIGLYRNEETLEPVEYYVKLPADIAERDVLLLDPMLATGNSTAACVDASSRTPAPRTSRSISLIAAPEGVARIESKHPDVHVVRRVDRLAPQREGLHRPRPRRCGRSPLRHEVAATPWSGTAHEPPEVVWGALIALVIVVLLTPAVGGMARLLGVVDRRGGRPARDAARRPPARRPRALPRASSSRRSRSCGSTAQMRGILLGAAVATTVGAVDDFRGLRWWEKLGGQVARGGDRRAGSASGCTASRSRCSACRTCRSRSGWRSRSSGSSP